MDAALPSSDAGMNQPFDLKTTLRKSMPDYVAGLRTATDEELTALFWASNTDENLTPAETYKSTIAFAVSETRRGKTISEELLHELRINGGCLAAEEVSK